MYILPEKKSNHISPLSAQASFHPDGTLSHEGREVFRPMMKLTHWKDQTKRGLLTPRSKKLEAIDKAFEAYELALKNRQGTTIPLTNLFNALIAWLESKGSDWRSSTRNSKIEPGGKGTVETLLNELLALNPTFRMKAAGYLAKSAPPPPPLMQHGARNRQKNEDGHWFEIPVQTKENSCGPCSIRLVIKLVRNEDVAEDYLRELVEIAEEGGAYGGSLGQGGVLQGGGVHDWSPTGGGTWLVPEALKAAKIPCSHTTNPKDLLRTSEKKPAIAVVAWTGGGLHYIVVAGPNSNGARMTILDPFYGVQSVPVTSGNLGKYEPRDPQTGAILAEGNWYNWVCKVT